MAATKPFLTWQFEPRGMYEFALDDGTSVRARFDKRIFNNAGSRMFLFYRGDQEVFVSNIDGDLESPVPLLSLNQGGTNRRIVGEPTKVTNSSAPKEPKMKRLNEIEKEMAYLLVKRLNRLRLFLLQGNKPTHYDLKDLDDKIGKLIEEMEKIGIYTDKLHKLANFYKKFIRIFHEIKIEHGSRVGVKDEEVRRHFLHVIDESEINSLFGDLSLPQQEEILQIRREAETLTLPVELRDDSEPLNFGEPIESVEDWLRGEGFQQADSDPGIFHRVRDGKSVYVSLHADDSSIFTTDLKTMAKFKNAFKKRMQRVGSSQPEGYHLDKFKAATKKSGGSKKRLKKRRKSRRI